MLPNVYGWSWDPGHVIFVSVFFFVALTVAATVLIASWRSRRTLLAGAVDTVRWQEEFHDLPDHARACRHELTGEFAHRTCDRAFDCRGCATHSKLAQAVADSERLYHRGHTWVEADPDGTFLVGLDSLAKSLVGPEAKLEMPPVGSVVRANAPVIHVRRGEHDVRIVAPLDGQVVAVSGDVFRIRPIGPDPRLTHLLRGPEVDAWFSRELTRVQQMLSPDPAAPVLADGGAPVEDMPAALPKADWSGVWGRIFLEP